MISSFYFYLLLRILRCTIDCNSFYDNLNESIIKTSPSNDDGGEPASPSDTSKGDDNSEDASNEDDNPEDPSSEPDDWEGLFEEPDY